MAVKMRYTATDEKNNVHHFRNIHYLANFLKITNSMARVAINNNQIVKGYVLKELDDPIELTTPHINDEITIQNVKCKVLNVYNNVCTVLTDVGTAVVGLKDMQFVVNPGVVGMDRQYPLQTRNY